MTKFQFPRCSAESYKNQIGLKNLSTETSMGVEEEVLVQFILEACDRP